MGNIIYECFHNDNPPYSFITESKICAEYFESQRPWVREIKEVNIDPTNNSEIPEDSNMMRKTEWQPIESAPKEKWIFTFGILGYRVCMLHKVKNKWYWHEGNGFSLAEETYTPTHWMPLPKPPEEI